MNNEELLRKIKAELEWLKKETKKAAKRAPDNEQRKFHEGKEYAYSKELLVEAYAKYSEIEELRRAKNHLLANAMPSSKLEINVNQCYGDMGMTFTNQESFSGELASDLFRAIIEIIDKRIDSLEQELDRL